MGAGAPPTLRFPLILFAAANMVALGMRLWPWQDVLNLPGNGAAGMDPGVCLLAYIILIFWIGGNRHAQVRKALLSGTLLGLLAGASLATQVAFNAQPSNADAANPNTVPMALLAGAAAVWGIAGLIGSRQAGSVGMGLLSGAWCASFRGDKSPPLSLRNECLQQS